MNVSLKQILKYQNRHEKELLKLLEVKQKIINPEPDLVLIKKNSLSVHGLEPRDPKKKKLWALRSLLIDFPIMIMDKRN